MEMKSGITDEVTEANRGIYRMEYLEKQSIESRIEADVHNLNMLPEDDDFGDNDDIDYQ